MIHDDSVSKMLAGLAVLIAIYLSTFEQAFSVILYPVILLFAALFLELTLLRRRPADVDAVAKSWKSILVYTAVAVVAISLTGLAVKKVPQQLIGYSAVLFGVLMAVAEERFFRKALTNFFAGTLTLGAGILASAVAFAVYHLARYGFSLSVMIYVLIGGVILGVVAWRSGRLSPVMIAHCLVNIVATV